MESSMVGNAPEAARAGEGLGIKALGTASPVESKLGEESQEYQSVVQAPEVAKLLGCSLW
jgi:hypothetical protein